MKEICCKERQKIAEIGYEVRTKGKNVVFPTDTVYGLGSTPFIEEAIEACFRLKGRIETKPVPVLFSDISSVEKYVQFDPNAGNLARAFWPGGLTLVLRIRAGIHISEKVAKDNTLAVRIPNNKCSIELIKACGGSLIGTSANESGKPPSTDPNDDRLKAFALNADYFIKGDCAGKIASTVLSIGSKGEMKILREGAVPVANIIRQLGKTSIAELS